MSNIAVSVVVITYGHQEFITTCLDSILNQITDFEFEVIISNDKSPDATDTVILDYLHQHPKASKVKYFNQPKNLGMMPNIVFTIQQAKGEYIATLEGDDYWIDNYKLQKQYEYLTKNKDFTIVLGGNDAVLTDGQYKVKEFSTWANRIYDETMINELSFHFSTFMFLKQSIKVTELLENSFSKDFSILFYALQKGKGFFINSTFSVYRLHINSNWSSKSKVKNLSWDFYELQYLIKRYGYNVALRKRFIHVGLDFYAALKENRRERLTVGISILKQIRSLKHLLYFGKVIFKN